MKENSSFHIPPCSKHEALEVGKEKVKSLGAEIAGVVEEICAMEATCEDFNTSVQAATEKL